MVQAWCCRKEGAVEVSGQGEADQVLAAAQEATHHIHGLGPGGNRAAPPPQEGLTSISLPNFPLFALFVPAMRAASFYGGEV